MAEVELKRCPFCGADAIDELTDDCGNVKIKCANCGIGTDWLYRQLAFEVWNRRSDDDLYKKGYKDGWNSCVKDKADGWMIDYM